MTKGGKRQGTNHDEGEGEKETEIFEGVQRTIFSLSREPGATERIIDQASLGDD